MVVSYALSYRKHYAGVLEGRSRLGDKRLLRPFLAMIDLFAAGRLASRELSPIRTVERLELS